jgi:hypothetical protein
MSERRELGRRETDDVLKLLAPHMVNDETVQSQILDKLNKIEAAQADTLELLTLFNNTKGFITTVRSIGAFVLWFATVFGTFAGLIYGLRAWLKS